MSKEPTSRMAMGVKQQSDRAAQTQHRERKLYKARLSVCVLEGWLDQ